jgi:hypothetical protein
MAWRKWLVRGLVFSVLGAALLGALTYEAWTNPAAVRRAVLAKLSQTFAGASVSLDSAHLRLLGGIAFRDLRMARREELDRADFLYVPGGVLYHDKEHLLDGNLGLRKVELDRPRLRLVRERDGRFNLSGLLGPTNLAEPVPTLVVRQGTLVVEDRAAPPGVALLEVREVCLTAVNDPLDIITVEGTGLADVVGTVRLNARLHRPTGAASLSLELPEVAVCPALVERLAGFCPDAAAHLRQLRGGTARVQALLAHQPGAARPWTYDVTCCLTGAAFSHARLPLPLEQLDASLHCVNGLVHEVNLTARSGPARLSVSLKDLQWPAHAPACFEEAAREIHARAEHLQVTPKVFEHLPETCKEFQELYAPAGPVSLVYHFRRTGSEQWRKDWQILPEGMSGEFKHFPYPIDDVTGSLTVAMGSDRDAVVDVDLAGRGRGSGRPVTVKGQVRGEKSTSEVNIVVAADNVPVDDRLCRALPRRSMELARTFLPPASRELGLEVQPLGLVRPAGLADLKVFVRRGCGRHDFVNRYLVALHDVSLKYDQFPYPLEHVTGRLDIQPDHWECLGFHGSHKGGDIFVNARSSPLPGPEQVPGRESRTPRQDCVQVAIRGEGVLLDSEFEQALAPPEAPGRAALRNAWAMLSLQGRLNFHAEVIDRPDQPQDIDVAVDVQGCTMQPDFFRYAMADVSAAVRYAHGRVDVHDVRARHGESTLGLKEGTIVLKPTGGFRAWFKGIRGNHLVPDEDFLRALHPAMRKGLEPLGLSTPLDVETSLVFDAPGEPGLPMKIWWDGGALLRNATIHPGLEVSGMDGAVWCQGHHNGVQFDGVTGYAVLDRATILGQPFTRLQGRIEIAPETPDVLRLYDLRADLFGGSAGGEARFEIGPTLHYAVKLDALRVQLEQFGKHNKLGADAQLQGPARASLYLWGEGTDLSGLKGDGRIEVANGKMYRLPVLLDLVKAFGLRVPDRTAFEQARVIFGIEGPQMRIHQLDLFGSAVSLRGQGTLNLDGSNLNLDFNADWGRLPGLLPPGISDISQLFSDQLFKIKLRGKISDPKFDKELMPGVVDPLMRAFGPS